jgi:hypothetical protein
MTDAHVVDTNVLIVASAADDGSPFQPDATPIEEAQLRQQVLNWLMAFEQDPQRHLVLDYHWLIAGEYQNKLSEQNYGWLAIMAKHDKGQVIWVGFELDDAGDAILKEPLASAVTDRADRKMVAAVLEAQQQGHSCHLVNACDTDWLDCEAALNSAGIEVQHLLREWILAAHANKHRK